MSVYSMCNHHIREYRLGNEAEEFPHQLNMQSIQILDSKSRDDRYSTVLKILLVLCIAKEYPLLRALRNQSYQ